MSVQQRVIAAGFHSVYNGWILVLDVNSTWTPPDGWHTEIYFKTAKAAANFVDKLMATPDCVERGFSASRFFEGFASLCREFSIEVTP